MPHPDVYIVNSSENITVSFQLKMSSVDSLKLVAYAQKFHSQIGNKVSFLGKCYKNSDHVLKEDVIQGDN